MNRYRKFLRNEVAPYFVASKKKPAYQQASELFALWRRYNFPPYHYFKHRLYELESGEYLDYVPPAIIARFQVRVNPPEYLAMISDKRKTCAILRENGIACADTIVSIGPAGELYDGSGNSVAPAQAIKLIAGAGGQLFCKPIDGGTGDGAGVVSSSALNDEFLARARNIVVQPLFVNHPQLDRIFSGCLNTVRLDTLVEGNDVVIGAAALKLGTGNARVDNWAKGSIAVGIELNTGRLARSGVTKAEFGRVRYIAHPNTSVIFSSVVIPDWDEVKELARRSALALLPHRSLGLDIAITPTGPLVIEANQTGDFFLLQESVGPLGKSRLAAAALEIWGERHRA
jgi:putative polysaccharide biosynthesis protein